MNGAKSARVKHDGRDIFLAPYTLLLVGRESKVDVTVPADGHGIALYFDFVCRHCEMKICSYLEKSDLSYAHSNSVMPMNSMLKGFFQSMDKDVFSLFDEKSFRDMKFKEICFTLCHYLEISDFAEFLYPALTIHDAAFRNQVLENFDKSYRVKSLAAECGYPEKQFVEKFRQEFGMMPKAWMTNQVVKTIREKLCDPDVTFKEIADDLKMSSVQSFTRFCKNNMGMTPSELREEVMRA